MRAFLGLGANLAQPEQQILSAIECLRTAASITVIVCSRLYASLPMGPKNQPDFINAVVEIETALSPFALLDFCQQLEHNHQRERKAHWGARTLDVDILSIDDIVMNSERLVLPHPGIAMRDFVVLPWRDIAPNYLIPALGYVDQIQIKDDFSARPLSSLSREVSSL